eukprot:SAG31_NODE_21495_length_548_cov_0.792873_1_plen_30_part_01
MKRLANAQSIRDWHARSQEIYCVTVETILR